jgi:hypothetical protein
MGRGLFGAGAADLVQAFLQTQAVERAQGEAHEDLDAVFQFAECQLRTSLSCPAAGVLSRFSPQDAPPLALTFGLAPPDAAASGDEL